MPMFLRAMVLATGLLAVSSISVLAEDTVAPPSPAIGSKLYSAKTPTIQVAACLPQGSSCSKGGDCCSGNCDPKHNKCGR